MSEHDETVEELPLLLTGELDRPRLRLVVTHLRGCESCRRELVEATAAHAALTATRRTLAPPVGFQPDEPALAGVVALDDDSTPLPPLQRPAARRPPRRRILAGAAAAALVLGLGVGTSAVTGHWPAAGSSAPSSAPPVATRQARLAPVVSQAGRPAAPGAEGVVRMSGPAGRTDMTIDTSGLPVAAVGHFYYAWLLDPTTNKMLPLGVVASDSPSTFEVASSLVQRYSAVDISLQADDGDPAHSPVSVLRATYA